MNLQMSYNSRNNTQQFHFHVSPEILLVLLQPVKTYRPAHAPLASPDTRYLWSNSSSRKTIPSVTT